MTELATRIVIAEPPFDKLRVTKSDHGVRMRGARISLVPRAHISHGEPVEP